MQMYQEVIDILSRCKRVLITTHVRPDGDALGSVAALSLGLRQKKIESEALLLSHLPRKYAFIFQENGIVHHDVEQGWPDKFPFERFDAFVIVDTGTWSQLPGLKQRVANWDVPKIVIDHHLTQDGIGQARVIITRAAAVAEIVAELLDAWEIPLDAPIASAIYLGAASD